MSRVNFEDSQPFHNNQQTIGVAMIVVIIRYEAAPSTDENRFVSFFQVDTCYSISELQFDYGDAPVLLFKLMCKINRIENLLHKRCW